MNSTLSHGWLVGSHFNLHFLIFKLCQASFHILFAICISPLVRDLFKFLHVFKWIISFIIVEFFNYFIVVQLQLSAFYPHHYPHTPAKPTSLLCFHPPPWFCPCVLYSISWKPFPLLSPSLSPLALRLFLISVSLVIFCLLFSSVDYVPVKGESIWYLSLTTWLISLSIMLSSSIHAVAKGISSFFLSAV